jgi:hypothetical protein
MPKKSNLPTNLQVKKTARVFKYNAGIDAIAEGNTIQIPFIAEYKGDRLTALEYIWYTKTTNGLLKRGIYVSGHGEYGVPTTKEHDVLIALQRIFLNKKTVNGVCELETENLPDGYLDIEFSIYELAKEIGYGSPNNDIRDNIKKSIEILVSTTIKSLYEGGIYDVRNKQYIVNAESMFHYIEASEGYSIKDEDGNVITDITKIRLSRFFYDQIVNDYKLYYNQKTINKTKNSSARKLYQMALQWKGNNDFAFANLETLIERMPMKESKPKYQKQFIKKLLDILDKKGMCKITYDKENPDKVYFIFNNTDKLLANKYNTFREIKEGFKNLGFSEEETDVYLDVENIKYIQALLRYMDIQLRYGKIEKPQKYFLSYLKEKYPIDEKYYNGQ